MKLAQDLSESYMFERDAHLALFPDAKSVLEKLHGLYPIGLITNGPADIQNQEIDTLGIRHYLDNIFIEGELRIGKPNQVVFDQAADSVKFKADQILMVGNSFGHDIAPAIKYGWVTAWIRRDTDIAVSSRTGKPEEIDLSKPQPDITISDLTELLPLLVHWHGPRAFSRNKSWLAKSVLRCFICFTELLGFAIGIGAVIGGTIFGQTFKTLMPRERPSNLPFAVAQEPHKHSSFPSSHTSCAFGIAVAGGILATRRRKWGVVAALYIWATLVGLSRIYRGVHWPTDVLGGALIGIVGGCIAVIIADLIFKVTEDIAAQNRL
jgi:HAD superfamily hydrolase (TIGR01549 family)